MRRVEYARSLIGTPWRHAGRRSTGLDCVGLMVLAFEQDGLAVDVPEYRRDTPWSADPQAWLEQHMQRVDDMQPGDVALIQWPRQPSPAHLALIGTLHGQPSLIHCHYGAGVVEHGIDDQWMRRIRGVYRWQR